MKSPNKPLFIPAGVNITERHVDCNYFATMNPEEIERRWNSDEGTELFNKISNAGFSREAIETRMGKFYGKIDLRGFNFSNQKIPYHNFADCDLFRANFENADCGYSDFSDSGYQKRT